MTTQQKIEKLNLQLTELESNWKTLINKQKDKIGYYESVSISDLGFSERMVDEYEEQKKQLKNEIGLCIAQELYALSQFANESCVELPLLDYTIPYAVVEKMNHDRELQIRTQLLIYYLSGLLSNQNHTSILSKIKSEQGLFNQHEVQFLNGSFIYMHYINEVKRALVENHFMKKSGSGTILIQLFKDELTDFVHFIETDIKASEYFFYIEQLSYFKTKMQPSDELENRLIELFGRKNLSKNLSLMQKFSSTHFEKKLKL